MGITYAPFKGWPQTFNGKLCPNSITYYHKLVAEQLIGTRLSGPNHMMPDDHNFHQEDYEHHPDDEKNTEIHFLSPHQNLSLYAERERWLQEAKILNWESLLPWLHAHYMNLKSRTNNWNDSNLYDLFIKCKCAPHSWSQRLVDMIDIFGKFPTSSKMIFLSMYNGCSLNCLLNVAFDIAQLIVEQLPHWLTAIHYCPHCLSHNQRGFTPARELQKPFSAAVDLYRVLENMTDDVITSVLKSEPQEILAFKTCPACFGPRPANLSDYPLPTRDQLIFCLDGNFQHRHHSWDYRPLQTPHIFLQPSEFTDLGFPQEADVEQERARYSVRPVQRGHQRRWLPRGIVVAVLMAYRASQRTGCGDRCTPYTE
ncbi:hypothetical protein VP01_1155g1 [Puccinia sorghi]|uniref:CxC1-like cysteine cluster associated with KDZ transposases domain-containing protein n=1 Tax=Puccinia sorghi TaxID=27349 RepID=A0A0L6VRM1_9BASI|nr:hypothetical protein VP01_1155g1 [Puccinia sorghi]